MLRASRVILSKATVRPHVGQAAAKVSQTGAYPQTGTPRRPRVSPLGIAFILGGLAFASYMFKPTTTLPVAALDSFEQNVAIIFSKGGSQDVVQKAASELGFEYLDVTKDIARMGDLVEQGKTRFIIGGLQDKQAIEALQSNVVQPDLVLNFGAPKDIPGARVIDLSPKATAVDIEDNIVSWGLAKATKNK